VRERPDQLGRSETSTDELIAYALATLDADDLLWTHVTSPMVDAAVYRRALEAYAQRDQAAHDSLMSVLRVQTFLWNADGPINYDRSRERWPRTQTLVPLYEVDSAVFLVPFALAKKRGDRVGNAPRLFELSKTESVDVDWEEDFRIAEVFYTHAHGPRSA
jgi:CMP-N-acetylneuraminic acid synthetase